MIPYLSKGEGNTLIEDSKDLKNKTLSIIYRSEAMQKMMQIIKKVANTDSSLLITGRSGTGKELITRQIHAWSYRKNKPLIMINCSCLNDNLADSELFGHEKGAFTGASQQKLGLLEQAHRGTVVLDEIGDLNLKTQAKLLRFLQESEIYRLGGKNPIHVNARVICSTNKDLAESVLKGHFREDLFYRINTIAITIPPLSDRREDIPSLLKHFLGNNIQIESTAMDILHNYNWPGNVRELKNICERLRVLHTGNVITEQDLPDGVFSKKTKGDSSPVAYNPNVDLAELNKLYILSALEHFTSKRETAKALGITVKTLYNRLHEYGEFNKYSMHTSPQPNVNG